MNPSLRRTLILALLALFALLESGALWATSQAATRGIPESPPPPILGGGPQLGMVASLTQYDSAELPLELERMAAAGVSHLRHSFYHTEPFNWEESDRIVAAVNAAGLSLVPLLDGDPDMAFTPPRDPETFATWAGEFASRYAGQIDAYIIWNEPNITVHWGNLPPSPAEYAALLSASSSSIRANDPVALIVAAPLAPTVERGPANLADTLYLQLLYEEGVQDAFDIVAAKPYGFDSGPYDRTVLPEVLNLSRVILIREVMESNGDSDKAIWAGNWGWNSLPDDWNGGRSIWGEVDSETRVDWSLAALERARLEWPWMGVMFLENWDPDVSARDPRHGFRVRGTPLEDALALAQPLSTGTIAYPGFHLADPGEPAQDFDGGWRFSPDFGADINASGDSARFRFYGTEVALRVRRADYRARFYVTIDGEPANALPRTEDGRATLILTAEAETQDYISNEVVGRNLEPGEHLLEIEAYRGWDQWALHGFSVSYQEPASFPTQLTPLFLALAILFSSLALYNLRGANVAAAGDGAHSWWQQLETWRQYVVTLGTAVVVSVAGWAVWGLQFSGIYRRMDDWSHLALTATTASLFYFSPYVVVWALALVVLVGLLAMKPARGVALAAASLPFYVTPKPVGGYIFSPFEAFVLAAFVGLCINQSYRWLLAIREKRQIPRIRIRFQAADGAVLALLLVATISLIFTERLDVASNEWRVVVFEPCLLYFLVRWTPMSGSDRRLVFHAFILGGLIVALVGLGLFLLGANRITAEMGAQRLQSIYGSPNNVALFLGRVIPLLLAVVLMDRHSGRRLAYGLALLVIGLAAGLTLSKGLLFLGLPAAVAVVFVYWQREKGNNPWPWVGAAAVVGLMLLLVALQVPSLAARLDPRGNTGILRLNLWQASLNMFLDYPIFGVGLDNFLYEYRGGYMFDTAWREPNLSHPHNLILDFATRLGSLGLLAGATLFIAFWQVARKLPTRLNTAWRPVGVGILGALAYSLAHGLVDQSFFLVDLAGSTMLLLGMSIKLEQDAVRLDNDNIDE